MSKKFYTWLATILIVAFMSLISAPAVMAGYDHYVINVYANEGTTNTAKAHTLRTTGITYYVLTAGSTTAATIYSDEGTTSKTNPVTTTVFATDDEIDFYIDDSTTSVDIVVVDTDGGFTLFLDGATTSTRTAIIDEEPNKMHHGMIWFFGTTSSTEVDTEVNFDLNTAISNVILEVITGGTTGCLIDIGQGTGGTNADVDGYIDGMSISNTGWFNPKQAANAIMGLSSASNTYVVIDSPLGALLGTQIAGTLDVDGQRIMWDAIITSSDQDDLTYIFPTVGASTGYGWIHYFFVPMRP